MLAPLIVLAAGLLQAPHSPAPAAEGAVYKFRHAVSFRSLPLDQIGTVVIVKRTLPDGSVRTRIFNEVLNLGLNAKTDNTFAGECLRDEEGRLRQVNARSTYWINPAPKRPFRPVAHDLAAEVKDKEGPVEGLVQDGVLGRPERWTLADTRRGETWLDPVEAIVEQPKAIRQGRPLDAVTMIAFQQTEPTLRYLVHERRTQNIRFQGEMMRSQSYQLIATGYPGVPFEVARRGVHRSHEVFFDSGGRLLAIGLSDLPRGSSIISVARIPNAPPHRPFSGEDASAWITRNDSYLIPVPVTPLERAQWLARGL